MSFESYTPNLELPEDYTFVAPGHHDPIAPDELAELYRAAGWEEALPLPSNEPDSTLIIDDPLQLAAETIEHTDLLFGIRHNPTGKLAAVAMLDHTTRTLRMPDTSEETSLAVQELSGLTVDPLHRNRRLGQTLIECRLAIADWYGAPAFIMGELLNPKERARYTRVGFLALQDGNLFRPVHPRPSLNQ